MKRIRIFKAGDFTAVLSIEGNFFNQVGYINWFWKEDDITFEVENPQDYPFPHINISIAGARLTDYCKSHNVNL